MNSFTQDLRLVDKELPVALSSASLGEPTGIPVKVLVLPLLFLSQAFRSSVTNFTV
jgi:hypothetical protein